MEQSESADNETMRQDFESVPDTWEEHLNSNENANGLGKDGKCILRYLYTAVLCIYLLKKKNSCCF